MSEADPQALRVFTAVDLPAAVRTELEEILSRLKKGIQFTGAHPSWVSAENLHLTLAFLGNQSAEQIPLINAAADSAASASQPLQLKLSGVELFPTPREPRVISLGVRGDVGQLSTVYASLADNLRKAGFAVDARPFRAHLTLARIKSVKGLAGLRDVIKSHATISVRPFTADGISVFQSTLTPAGPIYQRLHLAPFNAPADAPPPG
jgi:2'-5' RNA ligase